MGDVTSGNVKSFNDVIQHYFRVMAIQTSPEIEIYEDEKTAT